QADRRGHQPKPATFAADGTHSFLLSRAPERVEDPNVRHEIREHSISYAVFCLKKKTVHYLRQDESVNAGHASGERAHRDRPRAGRLAGAERAAHSVSVRSSSS